MELYSILLDKGAIIRRTLILLEPCLTFKKPLLGSGSGSYNPLI